MVVFTIGDQLKYLIVFLGSGVGGGFRYFVSSAAFKIFPAVFPFGTLIVNLLGSFMLGIFIYGFGDRELISPNLRLFLGVGFCGGFTTFSTFSLETLNLLKDSQFLFAGINILANVFLSLLGIYIAYLISR